MNRPLLIPFECAVLRALAAVPGADALRTAYEVDAGYCDTLDALAALARRGLAKKGRKGWQLTWSGRLLLGEIEVAP